MRGRKELRLLGPADAEQRCLVLRQRLALRMAQARHSTLARFASIRRGPSARVLSHSPPSSSVPLYLV
jgi:hypothetical protein